MPTSTEALTLSLSLVSRRVAPRDLGPESLALLGFQGHSRTSSRPPDEEVLEAAEKMILDAVLTKT